jgi:dolichol-phosphate mannosyltransferase
MVIVVLEALFFIYLYSKFNHNSMSNLVIIPTYNEKENIERMIHRVMALENNYHLLVIDDGSPDGTAVIVKEHMSTYEGKLFILERKGKLGLGTAYIAGFKWALEHNYEYIFEMDADFSHSPEDLNELYKACLNGADLAIGSRYVCGVNVVNWPMGRVLMSYFASAYVRFVTRMKIMDTTAGFKCYKNIVLKSIDLDSIKMKGYGFQIEMKFTAYKMGFKLQEVPIVFTERRVGVSKMSGGIFNEAFWGVIGMKIKSWFKSYKREVATA